jgi:CubicO group peptidase (beta-lactamase class C family)
MRVTPPFIALSLLLSACTSDPERLLQEASNATSQTVCTGVFVSGLAPDAVFDRELRPEPGMGAIAWSLRYDVDRARREVRTRLAGRFASRSTFEDGRGCTLVLGGVRTQELTSRTSAPSLLPDIAGPEVVAASVPNVRAAIDAAFLEHAGEPPRNTAAVVVVKDGQVVGERYAPGISVNTPLSGHSMAKSIVNALVGVLTRKGQLRVSAPALAPEWLANDPRRSITIDNLLRMDAGFDFDEGAGAGIATHMWNEEADTAHFAASAAPSYATGQVWAYSSRSYQILSRILGQAIGGGPQGVNDFAHREVFEPLGMHSVTIEYDGAGTMMGAYAVLATPRDWARFGLLYLDDGVVGGRRILPEGWVRYSTTPTLNAGYGAGFWLNNSDAIIPRWGFHWGLTGAPRDAFMARGYMGQYLVIIPSERLVVVRMGYSHGHGADTEGVSRLVRDVVAALHVQPASAGAP